MGKLTFLSFRDYSEFIIRFTSTLFPLRLGASEAPGSRLAWRLRCPFVGPTWCRDLPCLPRNTWDCCCWRLWRIGKVNVRWSGVRLVVGLKCYFLRWWSSGGWRWAGFGGGGAVFGGFDFEGITTQDRRTSARHLPKTVSCEVSVGKQNRSPKWAPELRQNGCFWWGRGVFGRRARAKIRVGGRGWCQRWRDFGFFGKCCGCCGCFFSQYLGVLTSSKPELCPFWRITAYFHTHGTNLSGLKHIGASRSRWCAASVAALSGSVTPQTAPNQPKFGGFPSVLGLSFSSTFSSTYSVNKKSYFLLLLPKTLFSFTLDYF